ncbi:type II toxin-antitoxin system RelE/ParE family toxin [Inquilinus limosus]|uniref:Plasmid stabilization protein ParE n=1 Tax=Inquilinus limosus TaxID=171674 RepID=A0A211ZU02_9PROT|nr:type II toxin-antitoxin system RelE/ParE family toxin [Inquilinus limosus]OWJ68656.1 plasmid stabilization protein ParE [Inquilinus limosus]
MRRYRLSLTAERELGEILAHTELQFGETARLRYQTLIAAALAEIAADPDCRGARPRPEIGDRVRIYHLRHSRERARSKRGVVRFPRHFILFKVEADLIVVGRILHDAMDLDRHASAEDPASW